ncbi:uncharacterized protein LOC126470854 [Schistocerca serialis cubense]|uniref:uncharacterized protein LOC126470847 n=1 Tax=Schistocerca serialis cubense TaxID=2023355 RepID=UPI00214E7794|nr:uncharacterized protein LOC126470847 [Schistocerca serialis cubense]XP_049954827.1 uncharacterized protein LOC126470854 [Schistocerca serialis cubense]
MTPYVILAYEAFALHENVMKPYAGVYAKGTKERTFNYRLSRARRVIENCFGILTSVFRVMRKPMLLDPEKSSVIALTTIYLHNYLRQSKKSSSLYAPDGTVDRWYFSGRNMETGSTTNVIMQFKGSAKKKFVKCPSYSQRDSRLFYQKWTYTLAR